MDQYWYIIKNQQHYGPYSLSELQRLRAECKLDRDTVLWHPRYPAPVLSFSAPEEIVTPPPAPTAHNKILTKTSYRKLHSLATLNRIQQHQKSYDNMTTITFSALSFSDKTTSFLTRLIQPYERWIMGFCIVVSTWFVFSVMEPSSLPHRPEQMAPSQYEQFQQFWDNSSSVSQDKESSRFFAMISKDYKTLWIAQRQEIILESVTLRGQSKNIMATTDFLKSWTHQPARKLISINLESHELPPLGFYEVDITWIESPAWSFESTQKNQTIPLKVGPQNETQLLSMLQSYHQPSMPEKGNLSIDSSAELKEKYQTLSTLISDLKRNWDEMKDLNHPKMVKAMISFQKEYAKSTGSFLTAFVLSNEKEIKTLSQGHKNLNTSLIAHLYNLTENAKKTGVLSAELMSNYVQYAKNPQKNELWSQKISLLEKDLLDKMTQL